MSDPLSEARATLARWHAALNARDHEARAAEMHFPYVRLASDSRFPEWATPAELIASEDRLTEQLREEGWITAGNASLEAVQVSRDRVHSLLTESCRHADGREYNGFQTPRIFTRRDGRRGLQFRSSFLAGSAQGEGG